MYGWRRFLLRAFGARIGKDVIIRPTVRITYPWKLEIGDRSWVGDYAELYNLGEISIGVDAVVSQYAYLCTGSHDFTTPSFDIYAKPIRVEDEAWVAAGAFIHPGVTISRGSIVGARAVVTRTTRDYYLHVGAPAIPVKDRRGVASS
jgi:putative colanic acid biosynthesis acetyltransferase WcaF